MFLSLFSSVVINPSELHGNGVPTLTVNSEGHALHAFINGALAGTTLIRKMHNSKG